jgi:hypothetical protein
MSAVTSLEKSLDEIFVKKAPALPEGGKKFLVEYLPWLSLIIGVLSLWSAYAIWNWAHVANSYIDLANSLSAAYGGTAVASGTRLSVGIWLSVGVLVVEGLIYLAAFAPTRDRKKSGWDLLFYASLLNIAYGLVIMFTAYGGPSNFIGSVIGTAIGLYLLFQIRASYSAKAASKKAAK